MLPSNRMASSSTPSPRSVTTKGTSSISPSISWPLSRNSVPMRCSATLRLIQAAPPVGEAGVNWPAGDLDVCRVAGA